MWSWRRVQSKVELGTIAAHPLKTSCQMNNTHHAANFAAELHFFVAHLLALTTTAPTGGCGKRGALLYLGFVIAHHA